MSYNKLFYEYVKPKKHTAVEQSSYLTCFDKQLRWWKHEAFGCSNSHATTFNIRHAHICNRNLEQKLGNKLSFITNVHGRHCDFIENQQQLLWKNIINKPNNSFLLDASDDVVMQKQNTKDLCTKPHVKHKKEMTLRNKPHLQQLIARTSRSNLLGKQLKTSVKPFSTVNEYIVLQRMEIRENQLMGWSRRGYVKHQNDHVYVDLIRRGKNDGDTVVLTTRRKKTNKTL